MVVAVEIDGQSSTVNLRPFAVVLQGMVRKQIPSQCCTHSAIWLQYSTEFLLDCADQMLQKNAVNPVRF